jgi:RNA polymerase sigma-54 factor
LQLQRPSIIQEQRQKLSPQMIQSIRLMSLPLQELKEEIQQEIEANPALEIIEDRSTLSLESIKEEREADSEAQRLFEDSPIRAGAVPTTTIRTPSACSSKAP